MSANFFCELFVNTNTVQRLIHLPEPEHKTANGISFEHPFSLALLQCRKPVLCGFVTLNESVITNEVGFLILSNGTVLIDTPLNESGNDLSLLEKVANFRVQVSTVCQCRLMSIFFCYDEVTNK